MPGRERVSNRFSVAAKCLEEVTFQTNKSFRLSSVILILWAIPPPILHYFLQIEKLRNAINFYICLGGGEVGGLGRGGKGKRYEYGPR